MLSRASIRAYSTIPNSIKVASKESASDLTRLSVVINNAGARNGKLGVSHLLSKFAFLNNGAKSALRLTRESELLGGSIEGQVTRDALILKTSFLQQDLPYYVEALGNVVSNTQFTPHEFNEVVLPAAKTEAALAEADSSFKGLEKLHEITFRKGLGNPLYYHESTPVTVDEVADFAKEQFTGENISILAEGAIEEDLTKFVAESGFCYLPASSSNGVKALPAQSFTGKEARIPSAGASSALIGIPVKPADFGKYEVLSVAIGNTTLPNSSSPLSQIPGATSHLYKYQDAGLFVISVTGEASQVAQGIKQAKSIAESVSASQLSDAVKTAELSVALQSSVEAPLSIKVSAEKAPISEFNYVATGDLNVLPYADEL
ncbi:QCR2 Cytochrome b-c1 complex subunit 2 [Candida maltosa Xu316]|uniref:Cytochrome b-c1 complex subunit 2, mitochondrial n=1 Tax=Candida maltosa (strain Xu316) TaxID=1245528 RepID=M3JVR0_CANMX|nr:putative ubiquinol cyt-c reductase core protein 2 [Candida maltosa Xu316]